MVRDSSRRALKLRRILSSAPDILPISSSRMRTTGSSMCPRASRRALWLNSSMGRARFAVRAIATSARDTTISSRATEKGRRTSLTLAVTAGCGTARRNCQFPGRLRRVSSHPSCPRTTLKAGVAPPRIFRAFCRLFRGRRASTGVVGGNTTRPFSSSR